MKKKETLLEKVLNRAKSFFLNGVLILLPLAITVFLFNAIFSLIKSWLTPIKRFEPVFIQRFPHAEIILAFFVILFIGFLSKLFISKRVLHFFEELIFKIPLVRPVYSGIKQLVHALTDQDKLSFNTVVLAEFPNKESYCVGFLTGNCPEQMSPNKAIEYYNVYIPTTPNPTTGFFILMPKEKIVMTDLTRQEAMTLIISGGIIQPDRFNK